MKKYLTILITMFLLLSCKKEDQLPQEPIPGLGGDDWVQSSLDNYLYEHFTKPYNIEVKYKWDPYEVNFNKDLVPPDEAKVIPVMELVESVWLQAYKTQGGDTFLRKYPVLKYVLIGSLLYGDNFTATFGEASGGNRINLYIVNGFSRTDTAGLKAMMHTLHHEFTHILNQRTAYPQAWRGISSAWYTATWANSTDAEAQAQGLVTSYAKGSEWEDFAETVAYLLVEGQEAYDALAVANPEVSDVYRRKELVITEYFSSVGLSFPQLQADIKNRIDNYFISEEP